MSKYKKYKLVPFYLWETKLTKKDIDELDNIEISENEIIISSPEMSKVIGHSSYNKGYDEYFYLGDSFKSLFNAVGINVKKLIRYPIVKVYTHDGYFAGGTIIIRSVNGKYILEEIINGSGMKYMGYSVGQLIPI